MDPSWYPGEPTCQVLEGGYRALIADSLLTPAEEIVQPYYHVVMKIQTYGLGDDNSVVIMIKGFPKVYRSKNKRDVTFVQVAVSIKEADKANCCESMDDLMFE